jgi:hypothetical protein
MSMQATMHLSDPGWRLDPPMGAWGPTIDVSCIDGGCSQIFNIASQGAAIDVS